MKVGILYPGSNAHPGIGIDFMKGIKTFLKNNGLSNKIIIFSESIGQGGSSKEVNEKAEKLLIADDADILVAFIDLKVLAELESLLATSEKLILIVNPGANYPDNWLPKPNIIYLTLQHSFLCWLTGALAGYSVNSQAVMASTFYDCGYRHIAAMVNNFVNANGEITFNYVNNQSYDEAFNIDPLTDFLAFDKSTNNLLCIFDSLPASLFYLQLNMYEEAERLSLYVSPMMLEQTAIENFSGGFRFSVEGFLPWSVENNPDTTNFSEVYFQQNKKAPSVFSLLGWEAAIILKNIYLNFKNEYSEGAKITDSLKKIKLDGPRGSLKLDAKTNHFITPVIQCIIKKETNRIEMRWVEDVSAEWEKFAIDSPASISSGWSNTYLCY